MFGAIGNLRYPIVELKRSQEAQQMSKFELYLLHVKLSDRLYVPECLGVSEQLIVR